MNTLHGCDFVVNSAHTITDGGQISLLPRPLPVFQYFSACNIEKLGVAWGYISS